MEITFTVILIPSLFKETPERGNESLQFLKLCFQGFFFFMIHPSKEPWIHIHHQGNAFGYIFRGLTLQLLRSGSEQCTLHGCLKLLGDLCVFHSKPVNVLFGPNFHTGKSFCNFPSQPVLLFKIRSIGVILYQASDIPDEFALIFDCLHHGVMEGDGFQLLFFSIV